MLIELGKLYENAGGEKEGPAELYEFKSDVYPDCTFLLGGCLYQPDGTFADGKNPELNLVREWSDTAVQTDAENAGAATLPGPADDYTHDLKSAAFSLFSAEQPPDPAPKAIYLSGPMNGYPGNNYPLFNAVAEQLRRAGYRVFNPAEFGADKPLDGFPIRQAFAAYSKFICEEADAIVLLPGWEASRGANAERALADNCGIDIIPFERLSATIATEGHF